MAGSPSYRRYGAIVSLPFSSQFPIICFTVSSTSSGTNQESAVFIQADQHIVYLTCSNIISLTASNPITKYPNGMFKNSPIMHKFSLRYYVLGDDAKTNFIKISIFFSEIVQPSISCFQLCCLPII